MLSYIQYTNLERALAYSLMGFCVIPLLEKDKRPAIAWQKYTQEKSTEDDIKYWWKQNPNFNIGIVTGQISGITVIDFDVKSGGLETLKTLKMPVTVIVKTGSGGFHYYYKYSPLHKNGTGIMKGVDIRNDGGEVVAPGSINADGNEYEDVTNFCMEDLADFPEEIFKPTTEERETKKEKWQKYIKEGVSLGKRNDSAAKVAGCLLHRFEPELWGVAREFFMMWNRCKCYPPLPEDEASAVFNSIAQKHISESKKALQ